MTGKHIACAGIARAHQIGRSVDISPALQTLLEKNAFGHVVTMNADGTPQLTLVWMDFRDGKPTFNTNTTRRKGRNLARDQRVWVSVQDPDNPTEYALIEGTAQVTEDGDLSHVNRMSQKFTGAAEYQNLQPGEIRVIVDIDVARVSGRGPWVA
jgi:PPOX class probable F420-dependent enzyme